MKQGQWLLVVPLAVGVLPMMDAPSTFAGAEEKDLTFTIPSTWTRGEHGPGGEITFTTARDPRQGLRGYIRSFSAPQQTALAWARDEAKALESKGNRIIAQPVEQQIDHSAWARLVWEDTMWLGSTTALIKGEQYYLKGQQAMVEVFLAGPNTVFERLDRKELEQFLSSVGFDTRSAEEAKRPMRNEELAAKSRPAKQADLLGEWQLFYQMVSPTVSHDSLFFAEHQVWSFSADGVVKNVASTKPFDEAELPILLRFMPQSVHFKLERDGVLTIERSPTGRDLIVISVMTSDTQTPLRPDAPLLKQSDLLLSYMTPQREPYMQRFLRRIKVTGLEAEATRNVP